MHHLLQNSRWSLSVTPSNICLLHQHLAGSLAGSFFSSIYSTVILGQWPGGKKNSTFCFSSTMTDGKSQPESEQTSYSRPAFEFVVRRLWRYKITFYSVFLTFVSSNNLTHINNMLPSLQPSSWWWTFAVAVNRLLTSDLWKMTRAATCGWIVNQDSKWTHQLVIHALQLWLCDPLGVPFPSVSERPH